MDFPSPSPVAGRHKRRINIRPASLGKERQIAKSMPPQSGLGEEIQKMRELRVFPHAHAWGYFRAPSGLTIRVARCARPGLPMAGPAGLPGEEESIICNLPLKRRVGKAHEWAWIQYFIGPPPAAEAAG